MNIGTICGLCGETVNSGLPFYYTISYKQIVDKRKDRTNLSKQTLTLTIFSLQHIL